MITTNSTEEIQSKEMETRTGRKILVVAFERHNISLIQGRRQGGWSPLQSQQCYVLRGVVGPKDPQPPDDNIPFYALLRDWFVCLLVFRFFMRDRSCSSLQMLSYWIERDLFTNLFLFRPQQPRQDSGSNLPAFSGRTPCSPHSSPWELRTFLEGSTQQDNIREI